MCKRQMELVDTIKMMSSEDYKERIKAEYYQVAIRYRKLKNMLDEWDRGELLNFDPVCTRNIYNMQIKAMEDYIAALKARMEMENIEL